MPNSVTKGTVTEETIDRMVQRAFGEKALEMQELKEGYFNIAYRIRLKDRNVVLKIAPSPEIRVMTCEKNIMFSEVDSMRMAAKRTKVPVPGFFSTTIAAVSLTGSISLWKCWGTEPVRFAGCPAGGGQTGDLLPAGAVYQAAEPYPGGAVWLLRPAGQTGRKLV